MRQAFRTVFQSPHLRVALVLLAAVAGLWFVIHTRGIWLTFLLACLLAYLAQPLMNLCERRLRARWLGLLVVLTGLFLLVGAASLLVIDLAEQVARFSRDLPDLVNQAVAVVQNGPAGLKASRRHLPRLVPQGGHECSRVHHWNRFGLRAAPARLRIMLHSGPKTA